ncbi:MAG: SLC26A/SulP transporter family protein [Sulfuritalea sp.]|nr:SLC26A/SulP transporter family protein [Sulfuritalea sp.]
MPASSVLNQTAANKDAPLKFARPVFPGDFLGPLTAALVAIPMEASYGIIAVAPLGHEFMAVGVLAAIYCALISNLVGAIGTARPGLLGGTGATPALAIAALVAYLATRLRLDGAPDIPLILAFTMLTLALAGAIQVLMSLANVGRLFKYMPYPVLAGFINGAALLLLLTAVRPFLGLPIASSWAGLAGQLGAVQPGAVAISFATLAIALSAPRFASKVPPLMVALASGLLLHYLIAAVAGPERAGATLAEVATRWPDLDVLRGFQTIFGDPQLRAMIPSLIPAAAGLALLVTVESLLTASVVDGMLHERHNAKRELLFQGLANVLSACAGGTISLARLARCSSNVHAGARTRWSALVYALIAAGVLSAVEMIAYLPLSVMGGLLVAVSWTMVDEWSRRLPRQLLQGHGLTPNQHRTLLGNYLVMLSVVVTAVVANLIVAVAVGVIGAMLLFVRRNSGSVIRRELHGNHYHSLRQRSISRMRELEREGWRIVLLELDGPLFFGTADKLSREIERLAAKAEYLILDFRRITDIDATGARILQQAAREGSAKRCQLLFASINPDGARARMLALLGGAGLPERRFWFDTADDAMEWAEEDLLARFDLPEPRDRLLSVRETQLGRGLDRNDLQILESALVELHIQRGAPIFSTGDMADGLYVVISGSVSVYLRGEPQRKRVASLAPGVVFGEMGLLDGLPRSADLTADEDSVVLKLTRTHFDEMRRKHPNIAATVLFNLSAEMATRLRYINLELQAAST